MNNNKLLPARKLNFVIDLRVIIGILLVIIAGMLLIWRPWIGGANDQTVVVTGQAKVKATPDEFIFNPSYQFVNTNKAAALKELDLKSQAITTKLKSLGVSDQQIKTNSSGYDSFSYPEKKEDGATTYTLQFTVTAPSLEQAQKIQDYLSTTTPAGAVSPQANFSESLRQQLEAKAREDAAKDARTKAEAMAQNLGFRLGGIKKIEDGQGFGVIPFGRDVVTDSSEPAPTLAVQPGENELNYFVTVTYSIR